MKRPRLVFGVGINDADFPVSYIDGSGKRVKIPSYQCWKSMLGRCYARSRSARSRCYHECTVCPDWLKFSNFHKWFESQERQAGWHLDKDLICQGNRVYGPEFCVFIPAKINTFLSEGKRSRRGRLTGGYWKKSAGVFQAQCNNPFTGEYEILGQFKSAEEAHVAWRSRKHELACVYADSLGNERAASALRSRFKPNQGE